MSVIVGERGALGVDLLAGCLWFVEGVMDWLEGAIVVNTKVKDLNPTHCMCRGQGKIARESAFIGLRTDLACDRLPKGLRLPTRSNRWRMSGPEH